MNYVKEEELAFLAENELIIVAPTVKLPILYLMGNNYGPFQPPLKEKVPIWLAILLRNRNKCRIVPPEWMKVEKLSDMLTKKNFKSLPFQYLEISHLLLGCATADIPNSNTILTLIREIYEIRKATFRAKIKDLNSDHMLIEDLGMMEINEFRPFVTTSFNHIRKLNDSYKKKDDDSDSEF